MEYKEILINSIEYAINYNINQFIIPTVLPILSGILILKIFDMIIKYFVYEFSIISGSTKREARKKSKLASDLFNLSTSFGGKDE